MSASSEYDENHAASQGRLHFKETAVKAGSWSVRTNNLNQWLQIDLGNQTNVTRVATQGRNHSNWHHGHHSQWVTKYKVQYRDDGVNFQYYREQGKATDKV